MNRDVMWRFYVWASGGWVADVDMRDMSAWANRVYTRKGTK